MNWQYGLDGSFGVEAKGKFLKEFCKLAIERCPRTLLLAVTIPDPETDANAERSLDGPRGVRLFSTDEDVEWSEVALMLGYIHAQLDLIEDHYTTEHPPEFRNAVQTARHIYSKAFAAKAIPKEWDGKDEADLGNMDECE